VDTEEIDWCIYRLLADGDAISVLEVIECLGFDPEVIEASLRRLQQADLIDRSGMQLRLLSIQESLLRNQIRMDEENPLVIENGVIRVRKREEKPI
jgi:Mn-dependent DtxR family transcriptional regulator